jgi:hypothetical protein
VCSVSVGSVCRVLVCVVLVCVCVCYLCGGSRRQGSRPASPAGRGSMC